VIARLPLIRHTNNILETLVSLFSNLTVGLPFEIRCVSVQFRMHPCPLISLTELAKLQWAKAIMTAFKVFDSHINDVLEMSGDVRKPILEVHLTVTRVDLRL
jgi:hypothetical protein